MNDLEQKQLVMAIGLPFTGKSTAAKKYEAQGWEIISRDDLLKEIIDSPGFDTEVKVKTLNVKHLDKSTVFQIKNETAIQLLNELIIKHIRESKNNKIYYDGTNLQKKTRERICGLTKEGLRVSALYFNLDIEEILDRAGAQYETGEREGKFNKDAYGSLFHMISLMEPPTLDEGFTEIKTIRTEEPKEPSSETHIPNRY